MRNTYIKILLLLLFGCALNVNAQILELQQPIGLSQYPNVIQGTTVNTDLKVKNTSNIAFNGTLYVSLHNSAGTYIMDLAIWTVSIPANSTYTTSLATSPTFTQTVGSGYKIYAKSKKNSSTSYVTIQTSSSCGCSNPTSINIVAQVLPDLEITGFGTSPISALPNTSISVINARVVNNSSIASTATLLGLYMSTDNVLSANDEYLNSINLPAINANSAVSSISGSFSTPNLTPGNYYVIAKADDGNFISESNENNNTLSSPFTIQANTAPKLRFLDCISLTSGSTISQGTNLTGNFTLENYGSSQVWSGSIYANIIDNGGLIQQTVLSTSTSIAAGASRVFSFNQQVNITPGTYRIVVVYTNAPIVGNDFVADNGCIPTFQGSTGTTSAYKVVIVTAPSPNISCGTSSVSPNPIVKGQPATLSYTISNTGSASYTGTLCLWWRGSATGNNLNQCINGLAAGASHTFTWPSSAILSDPGTYYLSVEDASRNPTALCTSSAYTVINSTTCGSCTWTNPPASGTDACTASAYMCQNGYIKPAQNGNFNSFAACLRQDLAVIIFRALFSSTSPNAPSNNFPTPFNDVQPDGTNNYWYNAVKNLSYLEYDDNISPFGRNFYNFNPGGYIERRYAMKVFLEAFNIKPSTNTTNTFPDIATSDPMFGYMKKAQELGLLAGLPNGSGGCFATCDLSRQDAFIILYRLKTFGTITRPTSTQLQDTANYFIPANVTLANMNKIPGVDQANFNHYEKTSFAIPGKGLPLEFTHTYNSFHTELPESFFITNEGALNNQVLANLGIGWSHNYNNYIVFVPGYTYTPDDATNAVTTDDKYYIFWGDGSIEVYNKTKLKFETQGTYKQFYTPSDFIVITDKSQNFYRFKSLGSLANNTYVMINMSDRNSNFLNFSYEGASNSGAVRLKMVKDSTSGRSLNYGYQTINGKDYLKTVTESGLGRNVQFNVNSNGDLKTFTDAKGQITEYYYDATRADQTHLLTRIKLPKGNIITNTYYQRKLRSSETNTNKINVNWQNQYSTAMGQAGSTVKDNLNRTTTYQYNTSGNPTSIASPTTTVNNIQYGTGSNIFKPQSMNVQGQNVSMNYDANGNLLNITRNGITQTFTYTSKNDVQTYTDGNGNVTTYGYDPAGNLTSVTRPSGGGTIQIERNSFGQAKKITNPASISTYLDFDANGNVNSIQMPLAISTSASYDNASRLKTKTDATGYTTSFIYDNNDNLTKETNALGHITEYSYDGNDNLTQIKNAKNEITELTYRFEDDFLMSEAFGGNTKSYTYDTDGSLKTFTKATGTFNYTYDATTGRLVSDGQTSYTYDSRNNIKTITNTNGTLNLYYDINDRLDYYDDYFGNRIDYSYDNNGNVKTITYPGNKTVNYTYDANNRMKDVTDWNNQKTSYTYLIDDRMDKVTYANGTYCQYSYDAAGRMTGMQNKKSNGTVISEYSFTLDKTGNHTGETINEPALATALSSLTNGTTNYGAMPFNRIQNSGSTNFTHNGAGNITQRGSDSYTFDLNDNLLSATGAYPATFTYDGSGNRRTKTANGIQTKYILNILGMSQVLLETDQSNTPTNYYIYGATGLVSRIKPNGTTHYYHYDFRGSTVALTDASQTITHTYAYDAFGTVLTANEPANDVNVYRYNGQYGVQYDAPNRTFMRARYYDPQTGRFISEDPIWATNLYPFADNNPVNKVDADGRNAKLIISLMRMDNKSLLNITTNKTIQNSKNPYIQQYRAWAYQILFSRFLNSSEKKINHNDQSNYPIAKQSAVENKTKNNFSIASDSYVDPKDYPIRNNIAKKQANSFGFSTYNPSQINMIIIPKNQEFYKDVIDKFNNWLVNLCEYFNPMSRP